jgi:hypothetical protein
MAKFTKEQSEQLEKAWKLKKKGLKKTKEDAKWTKQKCEEKHQQNLKGLTKANCKLAKLRQQARKKKKQQRQK